MDDILTFSDNLEDLHRKTNHVLNVLQDNNLFLKPEKCVFEVQEVKFLGMIIHPDNIHMDPTKLAGIQQWPEPHTVKQLHSFLGFCNFYRCFIPNYSSIAYPLNALTCTNEPWKWNELCANAFATLKDLFSSQPALLILDKTKPFILKMMHPRSPQGLFFIKPIQMVTSNHVDSYQKHLDLHNNNTKIDIDLHNHIKDAQTTDQLANTILHAKTLNIPSPFKFSLDDWTIDSDLLLFHKHIYIPDDKDLKQQILHLFHDLPSFSHPDIFKTTSLIRQHYWWPGLTIFVKNFINGCAACQRMKINTHPTTPPLTPIPADPSALPFQSVSIDFITDLPLSNSFDSLMVIVDHDSSKGIILCPCNKTIDTLSMALLYHQNVYHCFGLPKHIISDQGPQFSSHVFQTLCSCLGIKSKLSTAYHPQTDGQTERANQEIEAYLHIYCGTAPNTWAESIPDLKFSHNLQTHSITKTSPFNIILRYTLFPFHLPLNPQISHPYLNDSIFSPPSKKKH
ncbi:hypothetical protein EW145_g4806 [Phellinidium pouzarii]|uniref:Integrase catalytic domain-containing protein n=1 Tax=Phellinidium pouzarii TaxID=167371 RepID=A0A4S4L2E9_9AGAM|nr:hypothetical protein EW145_g4806 [Phellinidium pouzarii]